MRPRFPALASALLLGWTSLALADDEPATPIVTARLTLAARLSSVLPQYNPSPLPPPTADRREQDRPRNTILRLPPDLLPPEPASVVDSASPLVSDPVPEGILRLPRYEVYDRKLPALKERDLLTTKGRIALGFRRYPGLRITNFFGLNRGIANALIEEEFARERQREMADLLALAAWADSLPRPKGDAEANADSGDTDPVPAAAPAK